VRARRDGVIGGGLGDEAPEGLDELVLRIRHGRTLARGTVRGMASDEPNCLFCKILRGEIPCDEVAGNERAFAFRDINPVMPTHVLVIPRTHVANAHEIRAEHAEDLAAMYALVQQVAEAEGVADRGYRLVFNVGADSGNTVPHLHLHVLGGRSMGWPPYSG
jgi:histidine triad (HIT) family protein